MTQQEEFKEIIGIDIKELGIIGFSYIPKSGVDVYRDGDPLKVTSETFTTANTGEQPAQYESKKEQSDKIIDKAKEFGDAINPSHYKQGGVECIEGIKASMTKEAFLGYLKGNCIKYIWRFEKKLKPTEDLEKAKWYLERLIKELKQ